MLVMGKTTARDKVLYWLESGSEAPSDIPWKAIADLLRDYDALESAAIDALKRGWGRVD